MIVLDYLRELNNNEIIVPPFHTGHLGFIPNTTVRIGLIAPYDSEPSHCELIITPYDPSTELAILRCTMKDGIGVVRNLVSALSSLNINIVTQESSSINHQSQHTVNLLLDLSTSKLKEDRTYEWAKEKYRAYDYVFPLSDYRYLKIFEKIMAYCGASICWENQNGDYRIQLYIAPLERKTIHYSESETLISESSTNRIKIKLPSNLINRIQTNLNSSLSQNKKLKYLIFSDTKERTLRVYFPKIESWEKLVHIGVYHKDTPGALSSIFDLLANANFNIITGLLRKNQQDTNIWEGLLEFMGNEIINSNDLYKWVCGKIETSNNIDYDISRFDFKIGPPMYPKKIYEPIPIIFPPTVVTAHNNIKHEFEEQIDKTIKIFEHNVDQEFSDKLTFELIKTIKIRNKKDFKQRIFISYPYSAREHVALIKQNLAKDYYLDEYQDADGEIILTEVIRKIKACDFFLAVWHHDEQMPVGNGKYSISPWMPFEYGVALAEKKDSYIVHSSKLDERVWKRINPAAAVPEYTDLTFINQTLLKMINFISKKLKDKL
jgi:predicted amino acid-binding ACT domain protein